MSINAGFWDQPGEDRAAAMERACEQGGTSGFFDLSAEERGAAYDGPDEQ